MTSMETSIEYITHWLTAFARGSPFVFSTRKFATDFPRASLPKKIVKSFLKGTNQLTAESSYLL